MDFSIDRQRSTLKQGITYYTECFNPDLTYEWIYVLTGAQNVYVQFTSNIYAQCVVWNIGSCIVKKETILT